MLKYFSDLVGELYTSLGMFIRGYLDALLKLVTRPVIYAHFLLRRSARDKATVGPFLFLYVTTCLFLGYFARYLLSAETIKQSVLTSKPTTEIIAVVTVSFLFCAAVALIFGATQSLVATLRFGFENGPLDAIGKDWKFRALRAKLPRASKDFDRAFWQRRRWKAAFYSVAIGWVFVLLLANILGFIAETYWGAYAYNALIHPFVSTEERRDFWLDPIITIWEIELPPLLFLNIPLLAAAFYPASVQVFSADTVVARAGWLRKLTILVGTLPISCLMLLGIVASAVAVSWLAEKAAPPSNQMTSLYCKVAPGQPVTAYAVIDNQSKKDLLVGSLDFGVAVYEGEMGEVRPAAIVNSSDAMGDVTVVPAQSKGWFELRTHDAMPSEEFDRLSASNEPLHCMLSNRGSLLDPEPGDGLAAHTAPFDYEFTKGTVLLGST